MIKKGFTFPEMVLMICVLGFISIVTLPVIGTRQETRELESAIQRAYLDLNDFAQYFVSEHLMTIPDYASTYGIDRFIEEYKKTMSKSQAATMSYKLGSLKYDAGPKFSVKMLCDAGGTNIYHTDLMGRTVAFDDAPLQGYNGPRVCIDINGPRRPNVHGKDVFYFLFTTDGKVIPEGAKHPDNYLTGALGKDSTTKIGSDLCNYRNSYALTCAYYALNNINPKNPNTRYWQEFIANKEYEE